MQRVIEFPNLKTTRRYGAKVRTGCITCKARRIKCDEGKPACRRCTSTGRKCDGYTQEKELFRTINLGQSSVLRYTVPTAPGSSDGALYLEFYLRCAAPTVAGHLDNNFWARTVMQMAHSELSVRHAVIALGFLFKTEPGNMKHARSSALVHRQGGMLLNHYNKAVRSLVDRMTQPSFPPEVGLVTCLLFICIEFIRGDFRTAFTHLNSGLRLITELRQSLLSPSENSTPSPSHSPAVSTPSPTSITFIEDDIRPFFLRTIAPALLYGAPVEEIFEIPRPRLQDFQGRILENVHEARACSIDLRNSTLLFVRIMAKRLFEKDNPVTSEDYEEQANFIACNDALLQSLAHLQSQADTSEGDRIVLSCILCACHAVHIMVSCALEIDQTQYDAHIPRFEALMYHAKVAAASILPRINAQIHLQDPTSGPISLKPLPPISARFTFEIALAPCVQLVILRCRDPAIRREALSLLKLNPPREALWDADQLIVVANRVIEIEESELDPITGLPAERTRLWSSVISGDMDENGGFWVHFSFADWAKNRSPQDPQQGIRPDSQWDEWLVIR